MELDVLAVYGKSWMFMVDGTRYNGCIWELVGVYVRWNQIESLYMVNGGCLW